VNSIVHQQIDSSHLYGTPSSIYISEALCLDLLEDQEENRLLSLLIV